MNSRVYFINIFFNLYFRSIITISKISGQHYGGVIVSNLGNYQRMVTLAKKVGGPLTLATIVFSSGVATTKIAEQGYKSVKKYMNTRTNSKVKAKRIYTVHTDANYNDEIYFKKGRKLNVLIIDKDSAVVEVVGENDNPYVVTRDFLKKVSDFDQ